MEQLRILVIGNRKLWMSRKPNEKICNSRQFAKLKKKLQPMFQKMLGQDMQAKMRQKVRPSELSNYDNDISNFQLDDNNNVKCPQFDQMLEERKRKYDIIIKKEANEARKSLKSRLSLRLSAGRKFNKVDDSQKIC